VVAIGVRQDGSREVLGFNVGASETYEFWAEFLRQLVGRGLRGVRLVVSDAHEGLRRAISEILAGASWQRSRVHFMRNVLQKPPRHAQGPIAALVRTIFASRGPGGGRAAAGPGLRHPAAPVPPSRPHAPGGRRGSPHVHALPPGVLSGRSTHQPPGAPEPGARSTVRRGWGSSRTRRRSCGCWARSWKSSMRTGWSPAATSAAEVARRDRTCPDPRRVRGALSVVHYEPTRSWTRKVHHTPGRDPRRPGA
jgi:hypothetical protein